MSTLVGMSFGGLFTLFCIGMCVKLTWWLFCFIVAAIDLRNKKENEEWAGKHREPSHLWACIWTSGTDLSRPPLIHLEPPGLWSWVLKSWIRLWLSINRTGFPLPWVIVHFMLSGDSNDVRHHVSLRSPLTEEVELVSGISSWRKTKEPETGLILSFEWTQDSRLKTWHLFLSLSFIVIAFQPHWLRFWL